MGSLITFISFFSIFGSAQAFASSECDVYKNGSPDLYQLYCSGGSAKPAGANSTFSESFKLNPASLPTESTPYGLETIESEPRYNGEGWTPTFALVKGFHKVGAGLSTGGNETFYGDDIYQRVYGTPELLTLKNREPSLGTLPNLNLGTSFSLLDLSKDVHLHLGVSARYSHITNTLGGGPALLLSSTHFTLGAGVSREQVSNSFSRLNFFSYLLSYRIWRFEFEYNWLTDNDNFGLSPINIFTLTFSINRLTLTSAVRGLNYLQTGYTIQHHYAAQVLVSRHLSLAYLYNYYPGANSLALQLFL